MKILTKLFIKVIKSMRWGQRRKIEWVIGIVSVQSRKSLSMMAKPSPSQDPSAELARRFVTVYVIPNSFRMRRKKKKS
jgi:hypothetical protein